MCFSIEVWMQQYIEAVEKQFQERIWFIVLQGSYGRGETTDHSDIDAVLILDMLPNPEKICVFVSEKEKLLA